MSLWRRRRSSAPIEHTWVDQLDSSDENLCFTARVHLTLQVPRTPSHTAMTSSDQRPAPVEQTAPPPGVCTAAHWIRQHLQAVALRWSVLQRHAAQHDLNATVAALLPHHNPDDDHIIVAATAILTVTPAEHHAALQLQHARHEAHLDDLARRQTTATMRFLQEECFTTPATARLFLLTTPSPRLGVFPTAEHADAIMEEITRWRPESLWVRLAHTLHTTLHDLPKGQLDELLRMLAVVLRETGHRDSAADIEDIRTAVHTEHASPPTP
jgi:hypothetical protein